MGSGRWAAPPRESRKEKKKREVEAMEFTKSQESKMSVGEI